VSTFNIFVGLAVLMLCLPAVIGLWLARRRIRELQPRGFVPLEHRKLPPSVWVRRMPGTPPRCAGELFFAEPAHTLVTPYFNASPTTDGSRSSYCASCARKHLDEEMPARPWYALWR
jgi:hypothetical protein